MRDIQPLQVSFVGNYAGGYISMRDIQPLQVIFVGVPCGTFNIVQHSLNGVSSSYKSVLLKLKTAACDCL